MGPVNLTDLSDQALLLVDSAPVIYALERHPKLAARFIPVFEAHAEGKLRLAVTTVAVCEILTGPAKLNDEAAIRRYRATFESWQVVDLNQRIAESAARLRASLGLRTADAIQAASALAINAAALVTYDRDFSRLRSLRVIS
ncbi:MAG: type II toxin-antitoxin system VapC family toxin [Reyranella sp.]|uniref:type II toxin-antitoxin system VapC family toxin n=1 Tax=Reyranella sp. TaxID=1929291 RepID=UPI003D0C0022